MTLKLNGTHACAACGKVVETRGGYCSWTCRVDAAKAAGGEVRTPNSLPVRCIKANGLMLEHEHGDHPNYMYPVEVEFVGDVTADHRADFADIHGRPAVDDDEVRGSLGQTHALIYTDGCVAVTLYECCYALHLPDELAAGDLWPRGLYKLSPADSAKMRGAPRAWEARLALARAAPRGSPPET